MLCNNFISIRFLLLLPHSCIHANILHEKSHNRHFPDTFQVKHIFLLSFTINLQKLFVGDPLTRVYFRNKLVVTILCDTKQSAEFAIFGKKLKTSTNQFDFHTLFPSHNLVRDMLSTLNILYY